MAETSTKPYLIRAIHEWCSDNGFTPYIAVAVDGRTVVPREFVRNGEIVLNVSMMATHRLKLGNDLIEFQARFGGTPRELSIPIENVSAIYARENGHGMAFDVPKAAAVVDADAPVDAPDGHDDPDEIEPDPRAGPGADAGVIPPAPARKPRGPTAVPREPAPRLTEAESSEPATERPRGRPTLRSAARDESGEGGKAVPKGPGRGKQGLAVVPDNNDSKSGPPDASEARGDDEPPDPNDNPPRQSPPRLTRIK